MNEIKKSEWKMKDLEQDSKVLAMMEFLCHSKEDKELLKISNKNINGLKGIVSNFSQSSMLDDALKNKDNILDLERFYFSYYSIENKTLFDIKKKQMLTKLNTKDIFLDTSDFYKYLDEELYETLSNIYSAKNSLFKISNSHLGNVTIPIPSLEKSYINLLNIDANVSSLSSLTHETQHAIGTKMNKYNCLEKNSDYAEVDSIIIQLILQDYLCNLKKEDYLNIKTLYLANFRNYYCYCKSLYMALENQKQAKDHTSDIDYALIINTFLPAFNNIQHLLSFPYSVEFYELYRKDKKEGIKMLKNFILSNDKAEFIRTNDIKPGKNLELFKGRTNGRI